MAPFLQEYFDGFDAIKARLNFNSAQFDSQNSSWADIPFDHASHGLIFAALSHASLGEEKLMGPEELVGGLGGIAGALTGVSLFSSVHMLICCWSLFAYSRKKCFGLSNVKDSE